MLNLNDLCPIEGYENVYWTHPSGQIWNGKKFLKPYKINSGYLCVKLHNKGIAKSFLVHRLIAQTIPNPLGKEEVNHIDGNKENNSKGNLEWVTSLENKLHALAAGLKEYNLPTLGVKKGKGSRYRNVIWDKAREKWIGVVRHQNKNYEAKRFDNEEDAALHVNYIITKYGFIDRPLNVI